MAHEDRARWDARFAERKRRGDGDALSQPAAFVSSLGRRLGPGLAVDVAGGGGRNAVALAQAGMDVAVVDISPVGLELARDRARAAGVSIATIELDLEEAPLPPGPWDLILVHHFLDRDLYRRLPSLVAEGGVLAICHPTRKNLERHSKPSARFLLEEGELGEIVREAGAELDGGLDIGTLEESWGPEDRHEARLIAVRRRRDGSRRP